MARALEKLPVPAPPRRVISLVRDYRLYVNAIQGIVQQLRDAGTPVECDVRESENAVEVRVVLPRRQTADERRRKAQ